MTKLAVKPFQETLHADMCGPASLKIVLGFYGIEKSEQEIASMTKFVPGIGIDENDIRNVAESLGFKVAMKNESTFEDLDIWLKKGVPIIVDWFTRGRSDYSDSEVADGHYSVVVGLDDSYVYLQDPETGGERNIHRDDFIKVWFDFPGSTINRNELIIRQSIAIYK